MKQTQKMVVRQKALRLLLLLLFCPLVLRSQESFPDAVDRAMGSDQVLINGIQFSNHYGRIEGHPYLLDGRFRKGRVCIADRWHEQVLIRYNLFSQQVEIEYLTPEGHLNQIMTVAERMPLFRLDGRTFRRMQFPDKAPAYFEEISYGTNACYVGWKRTLEPTQSNSSKSNQFGAMEREYWLSLEGEFHHFHNRKTFLEALPDEQGKAYSSLLKQQGFSFKYAGASEIEQLIRATLELFEKSNNP